MKTTVAQRDEFAVVAVEGQIVRDNQAELREELDALADGGVRGIALGLGSVDYMDSGGLGCCAAVQKHLKERGSQGLVVFGASPNIQKMWKLIRLDLVIPMLPDEASALGHLKGAPPAGES